MKASAIVVAAGSGTRLRLTTAKAFVTVDRASLLLHVLRTMAAVDVLDEVVLAVPTDALRRARAEVEAAELQIPVKITAGGAERQDSVRIALKLTSAEAEFILIHDVARPFATPAMFSACLAGAAQAGAAIIAVPVADTLKQVDNGTILSTVPRGGLWQAQTPQGFRRDLLIMAHARAATEQASSTDDAHLCERLRIAVQVVQGSSLNLKITTPEDLEIAEAIAASRKRASTKLVE